MRLILANLAVISIIMLMIEITANDYLLSLLHLFDKLKGYIEAKNALLASRAGQESILINAWWNCWYSST